MSGFDGRPGDGSAKDGPCRGGHHGGRRTSEPGRAPGAARPDRAFRASPGVRVILAAGLLLLAGSLGFACEFTFSLTDSGGNTLSVIPGETVSIERGESYVLTVRFSEDHGNCTVPAENTMFLLDEEKWRASKDYLPLQLRQDPSWEHLGGGRSHETRLDFTALEPGDWTLEIVRECDRKEGYDESFTFSVS